MHKKDIVDFLGRAIFMALLITFTYAFAEQSVKQDNILSQQELVSDLNSTNTQATALNPVQLPPYEKEWVSVINKIHFKFCNGNLKIVTDNQKTAQIIIFLQKMQFVIKPLSACEFYCRMYPSESGEVPILS